MEFREEQAIRVLDLFAGAGGFSTGFSEADERFKVVCAVELDAEAAATFAQNHGDVVFVGSIEDWLVNTDIPAVDVVIGGPPCQGFSMLGKRDAADERNTLWRKYAQTLVLSKPAYFVLENVPTFLMSSEFTEFKAMVENGELSDYELTEMVFNAAEFGVPQARKRAIVIGKRKGLPDVDIGSLRVDSAVQKTVREAFNGLAEHVTQIDLPQRTMQFVGRTLKGPFKSTELHLTRNFRQISLDRFRAIPEGGNRFDLPSDLQASCWRKHRSGSGDVMGRLHWDQPSVTIRTEFFKPEKGRYIHPSENRAITHLEAARLQGFPDDYMWCGSKTSIARQIGNAVPVQLGKAIATSIAQAIDEAVMEAIMELDRVPSLTEMMSEQIA